MIVKHSILLGRPASSEALVDWLSRSAGVCPRTQARRAPRPRDALSAKLEVVDEEAQGTGPAADPPAPLAAAAAAVDVGDDALAELAALPAFDGSSVDVVAVPDGVTACLLLIAQGKVRAEQLCEQWPLFRNGLAWAIRSTLRESFSVRGYLGPVSTDFGSREGEIEALLSLHDEPPFTAQRLCEILVVQNTRPLATHKLLNCLEVVLRCRGSP